MTQVAHGVGGGGAGRSGVSLPLRIHELLLGFAGRLDDDALADARQMVASAELDRALEFMAGCLVAGKVVLTRHEYQELESLIVDTYLEVSMLERAVARERIEVGQHRFVTGPVGHREPDQGVAEAIRPVLDVLPDVRTVWCVWRISPAGPVSGPVPHLVVLVGVGPGGFAPATAYRVEYALRRAGIRASVEVLVDGVEPPVYHKEAMRCARQVPFLDAGRDGSAPPVAAPAEPWREDSAGSHAQERSFSPGGPAPEPLVSRTAPPAEPPSPAEPARNSPLTDAPRVEVSRVNPPWMDEPARDEQSRDEASRRSLPPAERPADQARGEAMPPPFAEQSRSRAMPPPPLGEQSRSQMMPAPEPFGDQSRSRAMPEPHAEQSRSQMMPAPEPFGDQSRSRAMPEPHAEQSRSRAMPAPGPHAEQSRSQMMPAPEPFGDQSRSRAMPEPHAEQSRSQMMPAPEPHAEQSRSRAMPAPEPFAEQSRSQAMPLPESPHSEHSRSQLRPAPEPQREAPSPHDEQSRGQAMPADPTPKVQASRVNPPWMDAPRAEPVRSAPGEPPRTDDEINAAEQTMIEPIGKSTVDPQYRQESAEKASEKPSPAPQPASQPPAALNIDTPTGSAPSPKRRQPEPPTADDKPVDKHAAAFGDDMLNTQERNLLQELQDELARREQGGSQSGAWRIDKSGRHGKPATAGPFDQSNPTTRPVITNGKPRPDQRGYSA